MPPQGTFVAHAKGGTVRLPAPIARYCAEANWTLFRVGYLDNERLEFKPVLPDDRDDDLDTGFHASLSPDGDIWVPNVLRDAVSLGDQAVMVRFEDGAIRMYLRQVFKTLGFRP